MAHRYFSVLRPVGIGTFPKDGMCRFQNFDHRTTVIEIGREAWGYLDYDRKLTDKEADNYDLVFCGEI